MEIINAYVYLEEKIDGEKMLKLIERAFRKCYKSDGVMLTTYNPDFIRSKIDIQHESPIEHEKITVSVVTDRGVTHEIVRHRIGSYSQESTRYCNYSKKCFTVINPGFWDVSSPLFRDHEHVEECYNIWLNHMKDTETRYNKLIELGATPQEARSILPNSTKTDITITYNLREWRHFFKLRTDKTAHPQMREIAIQLLIMFKKYLPIIFDDIHGYEEEKYLNICQGYSIEVQ